MSSIIVLNRKKDKSKYLEYSEKIERHGSTRLCASEISYDFLSETLEDSDMLFVHLYRNEVRGFACVDYRATPHKHLYINLICNAKMHSMQTRKTKKDVKFSGKHMIQEIIDMARKRRVKYVKLNAINNVITYYHHLGFTFQNPDLQSYSKNQLMADLKAAQKRGNEGEIDRVLNKIVGKYFPGFYSEKRQREIGEDEDSDRKIVARDDGIPMIYYLTPSKHSSCRGKSVKKCKGNKSCKMTSGATRKYCRTRKNKVMR